ncbi:hypothetical protein KCU93_g5625, partial [Aureobasidium melanogenum]
MSWAHELDTAIELFNSEQFDRCAAYVESVYRDNTPLYPRLRYDMLLAYCEDDWYEAENKRYLAENSYAHWCLFNPTGSYEGVDQDREILREYLDELADYLRPSRPDDWKDAQKFWTAAEVAEAEEEYAAELAEGEEELQADAAEGEEELQADAAEGEEELQADAAEGEGELQADAAEGEDEQQVEAAEGEEEQQVEAAEGEDEQQVDAAEAEVEHLALLAEAQQEQDAENAEAELEEGADLSPGTIQALNDLFDEQYDAAARIRNNQPVDAIAPSETSTKAKNKRTRIPAPVTAASSRSPRASKPPARYK